MLDKIRPYKLMTQRWYHMRLVKFLTSAQLTEFLSLHQTLHTTTRTTNPFLFSFFPLFGHMLVFLIFKAESGCPDDSPEAICSLNLHASGLLHCENKASVFV